MNYETVELERVKFAFTQQFAPEFRREVQEDFIRRMMTEQITAEIFGKQAERVSVSYPADWWQAVKARFAPRWFLSRWPAKQTKWEVDTRILLPDLPLPSSHQQVRHVAVFKNGYNWTD